MADLLQTMMGPVLRRYRVRKIALTPRRLTVPLERVAIDRPIFFLSVPGGGLTLLLKCFQRLANTCFCHGNRGSWDAADNEMSVCVRDRDMPHELSFYHNPYFPPDMPTNLFRYWTFATDGNADHYRREPKDVSVETARKFRTALKKIIRAHALDLDDCRLIDKSHLFSVNVAALQHILADANPFFVVVARSPYGGVPRTAKNYYLNPDKHGFDMDYLEAVKLCAQHWRNSFRFALDDGENTPNFMVTRIEDFFADPAAYLRSVCDFTELDFDLDMAPGPDQPATIYQQMGRRWHPLRRSVTDKARADISDEESAIIDEICGPVMARLGYA